MAAIFLVKLNPILYLSVFLQDNNSSNPTDEYALGGEFEKAERVLRTPTIYQRALKRSRRRARLKYRWVSESIFGAR
jgi:hypothetical protein